jgi:hypothetical protein
VHTVCTRCHEHSVHTRALCAHWAHCAHCVHLTKIVFSVHKQHTQNAIVHMSQKSIFFVHIWAKSRLIYLEQLSVGSGSLGRAVDRPAVLTRPVGRSGTVGWGFCSMRRDTFPPPPPTSQLCSTLSCPPQLAIRTAGRPPIQPTPTETLIL